MFYGLSTAWETGKRRLDCDKVKMYAIVFRIIIKWIVRESKISKLIVGGKKA